LDNDEIHMLIVIAGEITSIMVVERGERELG
jgi:hypothetical protein